MRQATGAVCLAVWMAGVRPAAAVELLATGPMPPWPGAAGVAEERWLALYPDRLEEVKVRLSEGRLVGMDGAVPWVLLRGLEPGPVRTVAAGSWVGSPQQWGSLRVEREGDQLLIGDGERIQHIPLSAEGVVRWVGDMDGDGRTDLLIEEPGAVSLWLSKGSMYLLRKVGEAEGGC